MALPAASPSAFCRRTAAATRSRISASGGTPAGNASVTFSTTQPAGVFTGAVTPPSASANAASSSESPVKPGGFGVLAIVVSMGDRPSDLAWAMKSLAAARPGRISSALALAAFSAFSAARRSRIEAATSLRGCRAPSFTSKTLMT